jgi:hypothetical protein
LVEHDAEVADEGLAVEPGFRLDHVERRVRREGVLGKTPCVPPASCSDLEDHLRPNDVEERANDR